MTNQYLIAGKLNTSSTTDVTLYTVPTGKQFISTILNVSNAEALDDVIFSVGVYKSGETIANVVYLIQDRTLAVGVPDPHKLGLTLSAGDTVVVKTDGKAANFVLFGAQIG